MTDKGASLIEVTIAMAAVAILLCLGEPWVSAATRYQGKAVQSDLAAELRMARHLAMTHRVKVRVVLDATRTAIRTERADGNSEVLRQYDFHTTGVVVEQPSNGPVVHFYPSGRSASPTTVTLTSRTGQQWQVTVSITGRVAAL
ncbi:GspH/FimT family pseudopilin [Candidatus Nitrospira bockiana]